MPKYLIQVKFTEEGTKGLLKEGGSGRVEALNKAAQALGGSLESYYFAFGEVDAYVIVDLPDATAAIAGALVGGSAGTQHIAYTPLITPEELDAGAKFGREVGASYRPPGQ